MCTLTSVPAFRMPPPIPKKAPRLPSAPRCEEANDTDEQTPDEQEVSIVGGAVSGTAAVTPGARVQLVSDRTACGVVLKRDGNRVRVDFSASGGKKSRWLVADKLAACTDTSQVPQPEPEPVAVPAPSLAEKPARALSSSSMQEPASATPQPQPSSADADDLALEAGLEQLERR